MRMTKMLALLVLSGSALASACHDHADEPKSQQSTGDELEHKAKEAGNDIDEATDEAKEDVDKKVDEAKE